MRAALLDQPGRPLRLADVAAPVAEPGQLRLRVEACGVCRTDLHLRDGELSPGHLPLVPGHQIVGLDEDGRRGGVPWLGWTCGECEYCRSGRENLCVRARFTGRDIDGGYAEWAVADERFCFELPADADAMQLAPLLCGGLIGHGALRLAGEGERLGLYGFGAAAHIICQVAVHEGRRVFAFTRAEDTAAQALARSLGAEWAGDAMAPGPEPLDAALIFAPAGALVPAALRAVAPGGTVVCAGLIGYRSLRLTGDGERLGLYGFGASAHIIAQVASHEGRRVFAFTRPGDEEGQAFARELGAVWAGGSDERPPEELDAAIIFAPVGALVPLALRALAKGGSVVCAGIHMTDIPAFPYELLWEERVLRSVANLTRRDGEEFLALAPQVPVGTVVEAFALEQANDALESMRSGRLRGSAVLDVVRE